MLRRNLMSRRFPIAGRSATPSSPQAGEDRDAGSSQNTKSPGPSDGETPHPIIAE